MLIVITRKQNFRIFGQWNRVFKFESVHKTFFYGGKATNNIKTIVLLPCKQVS